MPSLETKTLIFIVSKSVILQTDAYNILSKLHRPVSQQYVPTRKAIFQHLILIKGNFCRRHNITMSNICTYIDIYIYIYVHIYMYIYV